MSDQNAPDSGGGEAVSTITPASSNETIYSDARSAARALAAERWKRDNPKEPKAEPSAEPAAAEPQKSEAQAEDDAQPETADPVETTSEAEPAETLPPIEPPRSWTKEEKEEFAAYPREAQEKIARREQDRESTLRRSQNEAAERLKGLTAKEQAAEQARQKYEAALPALVQTLQDEQAGQFADIRTLDDVTKLSVSDPFRYLQWDANQKKLAGVHQQLQAAQERQAQDQHNQFTEFVKRESERAAELIPELADKDKGPKLAGQAANLLKDIGFTQTDLTGFSRGEKVSLYDHRMQSILHDAIKYREAKATAAKPTAKPVQPVLRPGSAKAPQNAADAEIQNLKKAFDRNPSVKNAAALYAAERRSA